MLRHNIPKENRHLQNSWNKYGEENFEFIILEQCKKEFLTSFEQSYKDYYEHFSGVFNKGEIVDCPSRGCKRTKEHLLKMQKGKEGKIYHHSEKTKQSISLKKRGIKISDQIKEKIRQSHFGLYASEETKIKLSLAKKGENHPNKKLTYEEVHEIREIYQNENISQQDLANKFKVSRGAIQRIVNGTGWQI
jgi:group I intron endonuclease